MSPTYCSECKYFYSIFTLLDEMGNCISRNSLFHSWKQQKSRRKDLPIIEYAESSSSIGAEDLTAKDLNNNSIPKLVITKPTPLSELSDNAQSFLNSINVMSGPKFELPIENIGNYAYNQIMKQPQDKEALVIFGTSRTTYGTLLKMIMYTADMVKNFYNENTDVHILLLSSNCCEIVAVILACHLCNIAVAVVKPSLADTLTEDIQHLNVVALFCTDENTSVGKRLKKQLRLKDVFLIRNDEILRISDTDEETKKISKKRKQSAFQNTKLSEHFSALNDPDRIALTLWTLGRSGKQKKVSISFFNLASSLAVIKKTIKLKESCRVLDLLPLHHPFGITLCLYNVLTSGCCMLMLYQLTPKILLECLENEKVTFCFAVPPVVKFLATTCITNYNLSSLQQIFTVAAAINCSHVSTLQNRFPNLHLHNGYGLCETTSITHIAALSKNNNTCLIGSLMPNTECKIVNPMTGYAQCSNRIGEIAVRGPTIILSTTSNPKEMTYVDAHGWLHTGDFGFYDKEECFYVLGKMKSRTDKEYLQKIIHAGIDKIMSRKEAFSNENISTDVELTLNYPTSETDSSTSEENLI
ncbi:Luciferin 4-monooxygenase [Trichinella papuae]|uniref:Luciferin 4-monooxygenase n=1 Tax=Trichinella papuae TaxID=268474 RepID=A0A0V1N2K3_9BILA|nr:Luciferin 4-monooxygenase [Trichinella papuae]